MHSKYQNMHNCKFACLTVWVSNLGSHVKERPYVEFAS